MGINEDTMNKNIVDKETREKGFLLAKFDDLLTWQEQAHCGP